MSFWCYYCQFKTGHKKDYQHHVITTHPTGLCYPGQADIELYGLKYQGKEWEQPVDNREAIFRYVERKEKPKKLEESDETT